MSTPTELTFWTWVPDIENEVALFEEKYPDDRRQGRERRPGPAALPEAAQRDRGRRGRTGCRADRVPVHPVVRAARVAARPDAVRRRRPRRRLRRLGVEPGLARRRGVGDPAGRRPDGQPLPRGHPDRGGHHRAAGDVRGVRDRGAGGEGCDGLVHLQPRRHPGRPDDRLLLAGGHQALRLRRRGDGEDRRQQRRGQGGRDLLDRADPGRPHLDRRRLQRHLVPGPRERQVRRLAHRGVGAGLPAGHGREHVGPVARRAAAAVDRGRGGLGQLGRLVRRRARIEREPDRGLRAREVHQQRRGVGDDARDRAVPLPAAGVGARGPRVRRPGSRSSTAARRSTSCSPRSRRPSTPTSSGCRSWTTCTRPTRRRWAR